MFKRTTKMTALLVAAASVISMVPAMAADTTTRLGVKDGTINNAISFTGKYIYEGYKGDTDKAVYFNDGSKDKELTDYEDYTFTGGTYGEKYALAQDGSDDYLVDLTNGSILDETLGDKKDSTASKLEKALKKTDKFDGITVNASDLNPVATSASFQSPWYYVNKNNHTVFSDVDGKYVDASTLANIYAYSQTKRKVVKIEKYDKTYSDTGLTATIAQQPQVIAQDKDYLYAIVKVDIADTGVGVATSAPATASKAVVDLSGAKYTNLNTNVAATKDKYTIAYSGTNSFTINGTDTYVSGGAKTVLDLVNGLKTAFPAYNVTGTGTTITMEAKVAGVVATAPAITAAAGNTAGSLANVPGTNASTVTAPATFTVGVGASLATFTYGVNYTNATSLRNAISDYYSANPVAQYDFTPSTLTFTDSVVGTNATEAAVQADLGTTNLKITLGAAPVGSGANVTPAWYLQKISKAQGDTDEDAYEPKTVASYQIDNKSLYDNGDASDAYSWLINGSAVDNLVNVEVKDGSLYAYKLSDSDTIKVNKLDLKQIKENPVSTAFGTDKLDGYVVKKDGDTDQDFDAYDVDSDGNLWILNDGKIIKFVEKNKTTVYTVDSGFNELSVYDQNNLVAWNKDDERYTTVTEGTKVTQDESAVVAPVIVTGWVKGTDGTWTFNDATGAKVVSKWINVGGAWYFLKADGIMATGWYNDNGTWYYLNGSGAMATGWLNDGGTWYYLAGSGAMLANTTVDGYKLGANGAWVK